MRGCTLCLYHRPSLRIDLLSNIGPSSLLYNIIMKFYTALTAVASLVATATAHGGVDQYIVGDTTYQGYITFSHALFPCTDNSKMVTVQLSFRSKVHSATVLDLRPHVHQRSLSTTLQKRTSTKSSRILDSQHPLQQQRRSRYRHDWHHYRWCQIEDTLEAMDSQADFSSCIHGQMSGIL